MDTANTVGFEVRGSLLGHLGQGKGLCVALVQAPPSQTGDYGSSATMGVYSRVKNPWRRKNTCTFAHL